MNHAKNPDPTVGLNMIVKDEAHVIRDLLISVIPYITTWTIVDTGSTDGTPKIIEEVMAESGLPGNLYYRPWQDFGTNRTEALELAKGSAQYHWVIDADDLIVGAIDFSGLSLPSYYLQYGDGFTYKRQQLFRDDLSWRYIGVLHEYPSCGQEVEIGTLLGNYYIDSRRLGARNKNPRKYLDDALVLERALEKEPENVRYWFYLGQSYFDAGEYQKAYDAYQKRITLAGWEEETFYAYYKAAMCLDALSAPLANVTAAFLGAYQYRESRAEPLWQLAKIMRERNQHVLGALFARQAKQLPLPDDILFVDAECYSYKAKDEYAVAAYYVTNHADNIEGYKTCVELAQRQDIPPEVSSRASDNLQWYHQKFPSLLNQQ